MSAVAAPATPAAAPRGSHDDAGARGARRRRLSILLFAGGSLVAFCYTLLNSYLAPPMSDDLWMGFGRDGKGLLDLGDVVRSAYDMYLRQGVRLGSALLFLVLFFGRWLWVLLNPVAFVVLGRLVFATAFGRDVDRTSPRDATLLLLAYLLLAGAAPAITEVSFWANGAVQYLWGAAAVLAFLLPYRWLAEGRLSIHDTWEDGALFAAAGAVVAQTSETLVPAAIGLVALQWLHRAHRREPSPRWFHAGAVGLVVGFAFFLAQPGNYVRAAREVGSSASWGMGPLERLLEVTPQLFHKLGTYSAPLLVSIAMAVGLTWAGSEILARWRGRPPDAAQRARRRALTAALATATAAGMVVSLSASPVKMSSRVFFGAGVALIIAILALVEAVWADGRRAIALLLVAVPCALSAREMAGYTAEYIEIHRQAQARLALVAVARQEGRSSVSIPLFVRGDRPRVFLRDVTTDPKHPWNRHFARYYGIGEVIGVAPAPQRATVDP